MPNIVTIFLLLSSLVLSVTVYAQKMGAPISASVITQANGRGPSAHFEQRKVIKLINLQLTDKQKAVLANYQPTPPSALNAARAGLPSHALVDMKGTPVLDQGEHGTCVTFAVSSAIDSLLGKGDYVSSLCSLMLGKYLEERSYYPSGWDGSLGPIVLNQLLQYGIVTKEQEKTKTCAGVTEYPLSANFPIENFGYNDIKEYTYASQNLNERLLWEPLITFSQRFSVDSLRPYQPDAALNEVKHVLATKFRSRAESRITFGITLPYKHCNVGACGRYKRNGDTWVLSDEINRDRSPEYGGHEMIIIGYDDNAIAVDADGRQHRGLLILRNSWGENTGDHGNFYMSYDFFKKYVDEIQNLIYFNDSELKSPRLARLS